MNYRQPAPVPDENQLEDRLERIQPQPGADFHKRMTTMPWSEQSVIRRKQTRRWVTAIAAIFTVLTMSTLMITPLRSLAQDLWDSFFEHAGSNTQPYSEPIIPAQFTPTPVYTPQPVVDSMTIEDARRIVPFEFKVPNLGDVYRFIGIDYKPEQSLVMIAYTRSGFLLVIEQSPLDVARPERIGPNAEVREILVGEFTAEYVEGYWDKAIGQVEGQTAIEGEVWVDAPNVWRLSWTDGMLLYRLGNTVGQAWYDNIFCMEEIVAIAESLHTGALVDTPQTSPLFTPTPVP